MGTGIDNAINSLFRFTLGNVIVTLTLGALVVFSMVNCLKTVLFIMGIIASFIAVILLRGEYDLCGLLIILFVYVFRPKDDSAFDSKVFGTKYMQVVCCTLVALAYYLFILNRPWYEVIISFAIDVI